MKFLSKLHAAWRWLYSRAQVFRHGLKPGTLKRHECRAPERGLQPASAPKVTRDVEFVMRGHIGPAQIVGQSFLLLALRLIYGGQFTLTGHGELTHLEQTAEFFAGLGIPAPPFHAALVGGTEMIGGALLVAGLGTRIAAVPLTIAMVAAYLTAHRADAFNSLDDFTSQAPYPFLLACLLLLAFGPGRLAFDARGKGWFMKRFASCPDQ
jgi:putative oxidoreductase